MFGPTAYLVVFLFVGVKQFGCVVRRGMSVRVTWCTVCVCVCVCVLSWASKLILPAFDVHGVAMLVGAATSSVLHLAMCLV